jgi:hypothetical protein
MSKSSADDGSALSLNTDRISAHTSSFKILIQTVCAEVGSAHRLCAKILCADVGTYNMYMLPCLTGNTDQRSVNKLFYASGSFAYQGTLVRCMRTQHTKVQILYLCVFCTIDADLSPPLTHKA